MTDANQKQPRVFYGWWIVGAIFLISAYAGGFIFYGFTAILEPIAHEFGWGYTQVSVAASLRGLETSLLAPLIGFILDRWGPRRIIFAGIIIIGLGLMLLSRTSSLLTFYSAFVLLAMGLSTCSGVIPMAVVGNWFRRRVSIATGIVLSGSAIGGLLVALLTRVIDIVGWRDAMMIFGAGAWILLLPLSLLIRHKPEQYGYLPDGDVSAVAVSEDGVTAVPAAEVDVGVGQALKSGGFWHVALGLACHVMCVVAVITHIMPYLSTVGFPRSTSSLVASAIPIVSILGRLSYGWFGDRYDKRRVAASGLALTCMGLLLLGYAGTAGTWLMVPFVILFGIGFGGPIPMTAAFLRGYFGRARLGTILGLAMGVMMVGNIIGPPLAGWVYDNFGSYRGIWFGLAGIVLVGMFSLLTAPQVGAPMPVSAWSKDREHNG